MYRPSSSKNDSKKSKISIKVQSWRTVKSLDLNVCYIAATQKSPLKCTQYVKQSAAIAISAIGYVRLNPNTIEWKASDLNNILDIGRELYKSSVPNQSKALPPLAPASVCSTFYIDFTKITTLVGANKIAGPFLKSTNLIIDNIVNILSDQDGCILSLDNCCYALWKDKNNRFFLFYPYDQIELDTHEIGQTCLLKFPNKDYLIKNLTKVIKPTGNTYELNSVKIVNTQEIAKYPEDNPQTAVSLEVVSNEALLEVEDEIQALNDTEDVNLFDGNINLCKYFNVKPYLYNFNQAYVRLNEGQEILRGVNFIEQNTKIPCANVAAILILNIARSFSWTSDTIEEMISVGRQLYDVNVEHVEAKDVLPIDITNPFEYGKDRYEIKSKNAVYGEVLSANTESIYNLEMGLEDFFKQYDAGVIQGPQNVAVWQELDYYYMFDAKERDQFGRKFIQKNINDEHYEPMGKSCITRYKKLSDLIKVYIETVPVKHRYDPFCITHIDIHKETGKSEDWNGWKGIALNKWIIRGGFYQGNERFSEQNRNLQGPCMAVAALIFKNHVSMDKWNKQIVDEIMIAGDGYYQHCIDLLKKDKNFKNTLLNLADIDKYYRYKESPITITIAENVVIGSLAATPLTKSPKELDLENAFKIYFFNNTDGILRACGIFLSFWQENNNEFYLFDSLARNEYGQNPQLPKGTEKTAKLGTSCVLRFTNLEEFSKTILSNLEILDNTEFNISRVDIKRAEIAPGTNITHSYTEVSPNITILRAASGHHEGQQSFDIRANKQTICNLTIALAMSNLKKSLKWNKYDISDILKNGDTLYCNIARDVMLTACDDFKVNLEHIKKLESFQLGTNTFAMRSVLVRNGIIGTPEVIVPQGKEVASKDEKARSKNNQSQALISNKSNTTNTAPSNKNVAAVKSSTQKTKGAATEIKDVLKQWDEKGSDKVILESDVLNIAFWKEDNIYYVFDPKAADELGKLTMKRQQETDKFIIQRTLLEARKKGGNKKTESKTNTKTEIKPENKTASKVENKTPIKIESIVENKDNVNVQDSLIPEDTGEEIATASAYVARLSTLSALIEHILAKVPEKHRSEKITLTEVDLRDVRDQSSKAENLHSFKSIFTKNKQLWIIRASLSQNDQMFVQHPNRNNQDMPNCITAITMATFCSHSDWSSTILDMVLRYGDRLYTKSVENKKDGDLKLNLNDIVCPFVMGNVCIDFSRELFAIGDLTVADGNKVFGSLKDILTKFFAASDQQFGILNAGKYPVAFWKVDKFYFMFDPHDIGPDGKRSITGVASLVCSEDLQVICDLFRGNCIDDLTAILNKFEMHKITIKKSKPPQNIEIKKKIPDTLQKSPSHSLFQGSMAMKILHGNMTECCSDLKWYQNPPTACSALAALAMAKCFAPDYWTPNTIDEILLLGIKIFEITLSQRKIAQFNPTTDRLKVQKTCKNFKMLNDTIEVYVKIELFMKGSIKPRQPGITSLKTGLSQLFHIDACGTIETDFFQIAVWKNLDYFYCFYAQPMDMNGIISPTGGKSSVIRFTTFSDLYNSIMWNVPSNMEQEWYDIRIVDMTIKTLEKRCQQGELLETKPNKAAPMKSNVTLKTKPKSKSSYSVLSTTCLILRSHKGPLCHTTVKQSSAICVVAMAMACHKDIHKWSHKTIDLIVWCGKRLFNDTRYMLKLETVELYQLPRRLFISNTVMELTIMSPSITKFDNLEDQMSEFLKKYELGYILWNNEKCLALIKVFNEYFLFNPNHHCRTNGKDESSICVLKFKKLIKLIEYLFADVIVDKTTKLSIGPIMLSRSK